MSQIWNSIIYKRKVVVVVSTRKHGGTNLYHWFLFFLFSTTIPLFRISALIYLQDCQISHFMAKSVNLAIAKKIRPLGNFDFILAF